MQSITGIAATVDYPQSAAESSTERAFEEVYPKSMFVNAFPAAPRRSWLALLTAFLLGTLLVTAAHAQRTAAPRGASAHQPVQNRMPAPLLSDSGRAFGGAPLLHQAGLGNTRYMPAGVTRRRLTAPLGTNAKGRPGTKVRIGVVAPVEVNEKVVNLTVKYTVPDVRTPFWSPDEKQIYYSSNQDPAAFGNVVAANGRYHLFAISSSIPSNLGSASTPTTLNVPTDPNDYLYPALNANSNFITFIRSSDGKPITDPAKAWVLCYAPLPTPGNTIDLNAVVVAGGTSALFPNASGQQVQFATIQRPSWLGNNNIIFSAVLQGETSYHIFQVNLQPTGGQSVIVQLTAGSADERNPAVAPDGKTLAFDSNAQPTLGPSAAESGYGPAGIPRQVAFPQFTPTSSLAVNTTTTNGQINRNVFTMNLIAINNPAARFDATQPAVLPAYTVRQFTERQAGAIDADNVEPAWSSLNSNQYSNPGGGTQQNEYLSFASTRQAMFDANDPTGTTITGFTAGTLHHIYHVIATTDAGNTVTPEGAAGTLAGAKYLDTGDSTTTPQFDDRYPTWSPFLSAFRIAFQSDRNGDYFTNNYEGYDPSIQPTNAFRVTPGRNSLFVATVIVTTAPTLLRFDLNNTTGEIVHINVVKNTNEPFDPASSVRNSDDGVVPGSTIHLAVRAEDREAGFRPDKAVFLQIKNPNSKYQGMTQGSTNPLEHKEYEGTPGAAPFDNPWTYFIGPGNYFNYQTTQNGRTLDWGREAEAEAIGVTNNIVTNGGVLVSTGTMVDGSYFGHRRGSGYLGRAAGSSAPDANDVLYIAGQDDQQAFSGGNQLTPLDGSNNTPAVWLELKPLYHFDPNTGNPVLDTAGNPKPWLPTDLGNNQPPGGVLYGASLQLPNEPSDWYIDVILYDNAVNPFDPTQKYNAIIYDNVWGFSSAPPVTPRTSDILVVADYALGQKFFHSRFSQAQEAGGFSDNLLPIDFGAEAYYTDVDVKKYFDGLPAPAATSIYSTFSPFLSGDGVPNILGVKSYTDNLLTNFSTQVDGSPLPDFGRYNMWRILSRGPLPTNVLSSYLPRLTTRNPDVFPNPATKTPFETAAQPVVDAQRMVIWVSPFSGDLFTGQGTIVDTNTQNNLTTFVNQGGRLFMSGQDIAFALTSNGATTNPFLTNVIQVKFQGDNSGVGNITPAGNTGGAYTLRIQHEPWTRALHNYVVTDGNVITYNAPDSGPISLTGTRGAPGGDAAGTVGIQFFGGQVRSDDVVGVAPTTANSSVAVFNHGGAQGMTVATYGQGVSVFASFGFETMSQDWYLFSRGNLSNVTTFGRRAEIMHNIACSLRSGSIIGQIIDTNGQPVSGALVRAVYGAEGTLASGTSVSDSAGRYVIYGLQPDGYNVYAYKNGYYSQHVTGGVMHGTGRAQVNVALKPANPGSLSGFAITTAAAGNRGGVFQPDGITPIQGITIQVRQQNLATSAYDVVAASTTSGADGSYSLPSIPIGNYIVIANPTDQNPNYNKNVATVQITATPNSGFKLGPGETVNPDNTITIAENTSFFANFFLAASPAKVTGLVEDAGNGNPPIPGAVVTATLQGGTTTAGAVTDANGNYTLSVNGAAQGIDATLIPAGTYVITATKPGYSTGSVTLVVGGNGVVAATAPTILLTKLPPGTVEGFVVVASGSQTNAASAIGTVVRLYPIITVNGAQQPDLSQAPLTGTVTGAVTGTQVTGYDNATRQTGSETIQYNFQIANVPGGGSGNGTQYIAILDPGTGSGLTPSPAQIAVTVFSQTTTFNVNFSLVPPHTYGGGLDLVSLPGDYSSVPDTAGIFGFTPLGDNNGNGIAGDTADIAIYNGFNVAEWTGTDYRISRSIKPQAGKGYFIRFPVSAGIVLRGAPITSSTFIISLTNNWNLIGNPFNDQTNPTTAAADIDISNPAQVTYSYAVNGAQQTNVSLTQAVLDNAVQKTAYYYTGSANGSQYIQSGILQGYNGYWFRAFVPVQMTLHYPGSSISGRAARLPIAVNGKFRTVTRSEMDSMTPMRSLQSSGLTSWAQRITVRQGDLLDSDNSIGVRPDVSAAWDNRYDSEKPPLTADAPGIALTLKGSDIKGRAIGLSDLVLPATVGTKSWNLGVNSTAVTGESITVGWPNIDRLPRGIEPVLVDLATGTRVSMRTGASSYTYRPDGRGEHAFRIVVAPPASLPLEIMNLHTSHTRSVGGASSFRFAFVATREVDIRAQIQTLAGRVIRSLNSRAAAGAESAVVWDGRSAMGADVPAGPYVVDIKAIDDNGAQVERKVMFISLQ